MKNEALLLLDIDIAGAVSATAAASQTLEPWVNTLYLEANFAYGAGGTSAKAYVQTSVDDGVTWTDIACFAFTTSAAVKSANISSKTPVTTVYTPTDGSLTDNTVKDGLIGQKIRVKYVTTGTYSGATGLEVRAYARA